MKTKRPKAASRKQTESPTQILAWENDPFSQVVPTVPPQLATPIAEPEPVLNAADPLPVKITTLPPKPPGLHSLGTPEFRYWAAADALNRGRAFWSRIAGISKWFTTISKALPVVLDAGVDFNAFYDRAGLEFFHGTVQGFGAVFSGESPDVVCHELGHAVLDALRPQLFDASFIEAAAFHESFGDMSALLLALQLPSVRVRVLTETRGNLSRSSSISRMAEQLGFAIRKISPSSVENDCLRNAANTFFYRDPSTLPPSAPASGLSSEPHSFSRVFTGAFLDVLAAMLNVATAGATATEAQLLQVSETAAGYLIKAIRTAPIVPAYYSQIAAAMVQAAAPADKNAVAGGFVHHGILSLPAAMTAVARRAARAVAERETRKGADALDQIAVQCAEYGIPGDSLFLHGGSEPGERYEAAAAAFGAGSLPSPASEKAARDFLEDLLQLGRVDMGDKQAGVAAFTSPFAQPHKRKTHEIKKDGQSRRLVRLRFDCGFDCACGGA